MDNFLLGAQKIVTETLNSSVMLDIEADFPETPILHDQPLLEQISILKKFREELLTTNEIVVVKRGVHNLVLKSKDILDFMQPTLWIDSGTMDVCLNTLQTKFNQSNFTLTPSSFCCKFYNPDTLKSQWRNTRRQSMNEQSDVYDEYYQLDFTNKPHILHPLVMNDHWVLLHIDSNKRICTIYDSLRQTDSRRNDIRKNALPVFLKHKNDLSKWTCKYSNKSAMQMDGR